jgi:hypothetical protein
MKPTYQGAPSRGPTESNMGNHSFCGEKQTPQNPKALLKMDEDIK